MKKFIIGALVLLIGIPGFSFTFFNFLNFSAGLVPILMILGGAIAVYLGIEELKQSDNSETEVEPPETQLEKVTKENSGKLEEKSEPILDNQDIKPEPEAVAKTEETSTNKPNEQSEPEKQESASPSTLPRQPAELLAPEAEVPEEETLETGTSEGESVQFKGNIETLVFHSVTCNFASGKNCSMDFTTKEEAEAQGYKPCKICMPDA